jgi:hypothetical protein
MYTMIQSPWYIRYFRFCYPKVLWYIQLQLFLSIFSLPILISWGLPISIMSCIGNFVFNPFLAFFLLLSCILFFLELLCIPNSIVIWCLELLTNAWSWLISYGSPGWLICFSKPSFAVLLCFPIAGFLIIHHKKLSGSHLRIFCFLFLLASAIFFLKYSSQKPLVIKKIPCNNGFVTVINAFNSITVIDPGVIGQRISKSWIEYTLIKELIQNFGTTKIDHLIVTKPGILTFDYCSQLCRLANVSSLYLVVWHGENEEKLLKNYGRLRYELEQKKGNLVRIKKSYPVTISFEENTKINIVPLEKSLHYKDIIFPALQISLQSDQLSETVTICSI